MATTISIRSSFARRLAWVAAGLVTLLLSVGAPAGEAGSTAGYGWPVEPFFAQHPVRGFFGDPRIGPTPKGITHRFHFGIDVACANGTAVYATIDGRARVESFRPETVAVEGDANTELQYWHIEPSVANGQRVVAYRTVVGHVLAPWAHVHLAEMRDGRYVNPLRAGGLRPFADGTRPSVRALRVERDGRVLAGGAASGTFDLVVEAYDVTPLPVPAPWTGKPVTPALLRWRLLRHSGQSATGWHVSIDVRSTIPSDDRYDSVFARWTRQNKVQRVGRYRFYLAHGIDASRLAPGRYVVQVEAGDIRGNTGRASFPVVLGPAV